MYRSIIVILVLFFFCVSLGGHEGTAQKEGETEARAEKNRNKNTAPNLIVGAKLVWARGPNGKETIEIKSRKELTMLSAAMCAVRDIDSRSFLVGESHEIWGELYLSTKKCHYRIEINPYGYWLDSEFPRFRQRFLSVPLTNSIDAILTRSGIDDIGEEIKIPLTGYDGIIREEQDWKEIIEGKYDRLGPGWDIGSPHFPFFPLDPEANPNLKKSSIRWRPQGDTDPD